MSQENSTSEKTKETRKKLAHGGLLIVLVGMVYFQFFSGSGAPGPAPKVASATTRPSPSPTPPRTTQQRCGTPDQIIDRPLELASIQQNRIDSCSGTGRNIFVYPTQTPLPPTPPPAPTPTPVPPPITIFSLNPGGV